MFGVRAVRLQVTRQEGVQSGGHVASLHVICGSGVKVDVLASMWRVAELSES